MTKSSSSKSLEVFDFNEEDDELTKIADRKLMGIFGNHSADTSPLLKYSFLEFAARGVNDQAKEVGEAPCVDVDAMDGDQSCDNGVQRSNSTRDEQNLHCGVDDHKPGIVLSGPEGRDLSPEAPLLPGSDAIMESPSSSNSTLGKSDRHSSSDDQKPGGVFSRLEKSDSSPGSPLPGSDRLNCAILESPPSSNEAVEPFTDADECMRETSSLTPASAIVEDSDGEASDDCFGNWEKDHLDKAVYFCPDYVSFRDKYCTASLLAFSGIGIKLKCSIGSQEFCVYHWGIDDVIGIESQWYGGVETAQVKLRVMSKNVVVAENAYGTSGIEELKFAVVDPHWSEKQEEIRSLDVRYRAVWDVELDGRDENNMLGQNNDFFHKLYFPSFDMPFEEVVYPKGDTDAVSISKRDVDLLQPDTFINDTIIDFYIKYLKNIIRPEEKHRFHFFNSFFFRKLADLDKDPSSASDGRAAFLRVRKWTRKVNLFEKDYIFIPVNFSFHWSLIVICHAGEVTNFEVSDEDICKSIKVPCILHMDSIKGSHAGLKDIIQSYLWEEWKEKHKETPEDLSLKFFNLRFVSLELPQQENSFDCGLFLLHYAECFLEDVPVNFNPFKLAKSSNFLSTDWFPPSEVSLKRALIQRLIYELLESHSGESSGDCSNEQQLKIPQNNENETCVEFVGERFSPSKACHGNLSTSQDGQGIEITLLATSSLRSAQCVSDSGFVLRELFEPGATAGSFLEQQCHSFHSGAMAPILEVEAGQHFGYSTSGEAVYEQLGGITSEPCTLAYSCGEPRAESSWNPGISMEQHDQEDVTSSPEALSCASEDSLGIGFDKISSAREDPDRSQNEEADQPRSPPPEYTVCSTEHLTSGSSELEEVAQDSQDPDTSLPPSNENDESAPSCPENPLVSFPPDLGLEENKDVTHDNNVHLIADDLVLESDEQQAAKRLRLTPTLEGERRLARSLSNDLHL